MDDLERYFEPFRAETIGHEQVFRSPYGERRIVYADWVASGRLYRPIERRLLEGLGPFVGNTHSEASETGRAMTLAYREARRILKEHVHSGPDDILLTTGSGMTGAINKFQRILGLKAPEGLRRFVRLEERERPVVFVTHLEHHSNHTSWYETIADVEVIPPDAAGVVDLDALDALLERYRDRPLLLGAFSACSNVTGVFTPYHEMAKRMHRAGGVAVVDFAASAPYVPIDMHPADPEARLDAVLFSPHKFLGGPGAAGVVVFARALHHNAAPDEAGGGTVAWTNPWGGYAFLDDLEAREEAIVPYAMDALERIPGLHLLARGQRRRLAILSFHVEGIHYNLMVRLLSDRFGVQSRGGCSCAGTYGHYLLNVDPTMSKAITDRIDFGDLSAKPGWVRLSFHPTTTWADIDQSVEAVREVVAHAAAWGADYRYSPVSNEYTHRDGPGAAPALVRDWLGAL